MPEIATTKMDGLRRSYGVRDRKGLAYFAVHRVADREHRAAWRSWLEKQEDELRGCKSKEVAIDDNQVLDTAERALAALWGGLDAEERAQSIHSGSPWLSAELLGR